MYAESEVRAGMLFLDERVPGWWCRVDVDELRIRENDKCVLGQLFGSYDRACVELNMSYEDTTRLGFYRNDGFCLDVQPFEMIGAPDTTWQERYAMLQETWKVLLVERGLFGR